ncbi:DUF87 domain-containing protein [Planktomarina temperata]|nr:DUF87 domain-containing protein [Planktomarina temperata]
MTRKPTSTMLLPLPRKSYDLLHIGTNAKDERLSVNYAQRAAHMHVIGRTGSGKSRFLAGLLKQDIIANRGLCLLDPHGELVEYLLSWMTWDSIGKLVAETKPIRLITLDDPTTTFCFNPLAINHPEEAHGASSIVVDAFTKIYGGDNPTDTPLIKDVMGVICKVLALQGLPLAAAESFLDISQIEVRHMIADNTPDPYLRARAMQFAEMNAREYREAVESTTRRFNSFFEIPLFRRIFSSTENTIDFRSAIENGDMLLFDLRKRSKRFGDLERNAFGQFIVNYITATVQERDTLPKPRPFNLYIDEVQNFVSPDIGNVLEECRKYGLFLTLAHQHLQQLLDAGEGIYHGVMSCSLLKTVFQTTFHDAHILCDELFADEIDFEKVKESLTAPQVIGHRLRTLQGGSRGETTGTNEVEALTETDTRARGLTNSTGRGGGSTSGAGSVASEGMVSGIDSGFLSSGAGDALSMNTGSGLSNFDANSESWQEMQGETDMEGKALGRGTAKGRSEQSSWSENWSQTLEPIIKMVASQTHGLEEQRYALARRISTLPQRTAYFGIAGRGIMKIQSLPNPDMPAMPLAQAKLVQKLTQNTPFVIPVEAGETAAQNLRLQLGLAVPEVESDDDELPEL